MQSEATSHGLFTRFKSIFVNSEEVQEEEQSPHVLVEEEESHSPEEQELPEFEQIAIVRTVDEPFDSLDEEIGTIPEHHVADEPVPVATAPSAVIAGDLDIRFATSFIQSGGKFIYCESISEAVENLKMMKKEMGWSHVFCWENEIKDAFSDNGFQKGAVGFTIETSDVAISLCESLNADEGVIILNPKQASRRRLPCFPKTHILLADISQLTPNEEQGLMRFYAGHNGELPSVIKIGTCNTGHFYNKQRLILNSEGTEDIYVILIDERIPPSTRP